MLKTVPGMDVVKFGKNGSDATSAATRLARAFTGRDRILMCKDTGFFSIGDWFIGKTETNAGVPQCVQDLSSYFFYNDIDKLKRMFDEHKDEIACVIMEPAVVSEPKNNFLNKVKKVCHDNGAVFIFDEMITGFRWHLGGAQSYFKVTPDLSTFGKAMANGFSVSALMGKQEIMERGGLEHQKERVFLLSLTHGGETHELAAALATISEMKEKNVIEHIWNVGTKLKDGINKLARESDLENIVSCVGYPCSPVILTMIDGKTSFPLRTLFLQEAVARGVLMPWIALSYSHSDAELHNTLEVVSDAINVCKNGLSEGLEKYLKSKVVKPVFRRYN
jgi:glutamate-1-semialdehyde 2,1-aminomutase